MSSDRRSVGLQLEDLHRGRSALVHRPLPETLDECDDVLVPEIRCVQSRIASTTLRVAGTLVPKCSSSLFR